MFSIEKKTETSIKKKKRYLFWKRFYYQSESIDKSGAGEITEKMYDFTSFPTDTQNLRRLRRRSAVSPNGEQFRE